MVKYFFRATENAHVQLPSLYDFVWPTASAMWNLRWQVAGYLLAVPDATVAQLQSRFAEGADIEGANFRRACVDHTWDQQRAAFAAVLLVNSIATFEGWAEELLDEIDSHDDAYVKSLQFPDSTAKSGKGVLWVISDITSAESGVLKSCFYGRLAGKRLCAASKLDEMLLCYRFFKEQRNAVAHRGSRADKKLIDAYGNFSRVATAAKLGVKEVPDHRVPVLGERVSLSLRGVVGFTGLLHKIIASVDSELSRSQKAEFAFVAKWKAANPHRKTLSAVVSDRDRQIIRLSENAGFPRPDSVGKLGDWLGRLGLTYF